MVHRRVVADDEAEPRGQRADGDGADHQGLQPRAQQTGRCRRRDEYSDHECRAHRADCGDHHQRDDEVHGQVDPQQRIAHCFGTGLVERAQQELLADRDQHPECDDGNCGGGDDVGSVDREDASEEEGGEIGRVAAVA